MPNCTDSRDKWGEKKKDETLDGDHIRIIFKRTSVFCKQNYNMTSKATIFKLKICLPLMKYE